jgi:hypothetical protein
MAEFKIVHDTETGEISEIQLTKEEITQRKIDKSESDAKLKEKELADAQAAAAKKVILDRLGLTEDELKTILG